MTEHDDIQRLVDALSHENASVRASTLAYIAEHKIDVPLAAVHKLLKDLDPKVQAVAAFALSKIGDHSSLSHLQDAWKTAPAGETHLRRQLLIALADIGGANAFEFLLDSFAEWDAELQELALNFLSDKAETRGPELLKRISKQDLDFDTHAAVERALHKKGINQKRAELSAAISIQGGRESARGIVAIWRNGRVVWSQDQIEGGPPYHVGQADPKLVARALEEIRQAIVKNNWPSVRHHFGPDSLRTQIVVYDDQEKILEIVSWHELFEINENLVVTATGVEPLQGRERANVLAAQPATYRSFRQQWQYVKERMLQLIPETGYKVTNQEEDWQSR